MSEVPDTLVWWSKKVKKMIFFQAEDGIRDRSPSRGLGDVYKRQDLCCLRKGVTDFLEWSIFSGERGLLQACSKFHPVVVITLL